MRTTVTIDDALIEAGIVRDEVYVTTQSNTSGSSLAVNAASIAIHRRRRPTRAAGGWVWNSAACAQKCWWI